MFPRKLQASIILQALIFIGGAGAGVGVWVGNTYIFEPELVAPEIKDVTLTCIMQEGTTSGIVVADVTLDRMGLCRATAVLPDKTTIDKIPEDVYANRWRFIFLNPGMTVHSRVLREGQLPNWLDEFKVTSGTSGWAREKEWTLSR